MFICPCGRSVDGLDHLTDHGAARMGHHASIIRLCLHCIGKLYVTFASFFKVAFNVFPVECCTRQTRASVREVAPSVAHACNALELKYLPGVRYSPCNAS